MSQLSSEGLTLIHSGNDSPASPHPGQTILYCKQDGHLYCKDPDGKETKLGDILQSFILANNQISPAIVDSWSLSSANNVQINYTINRHGNLESGVLFLITNGTDTNLTQQNSTVGSTGVSFIATVSGSNLLLEYTSSNTGFTGVMKYSAKTWVA